jgi:hypothetical protein
LEKKGAQTGWIRGLLRLKILFRERSKRAKWVKVALIYRFGQGELAGARDIDLLDIPGKQPISIF